jgi:hypothetical protein
MHAHGKSTYSMRMPPLSAEEIPKRIVHSAIVSAILKIIQFSPAENTQSGKNIFNKVLDILVR